MGRKNKKNRKKNQQKPKKIPKKEGLKQRIIEFSSQYTNKLEDIVRQSSQIIKQKYKTIKEYAERPQNFDKVAGTICCTALLSYCILLYATNPEPMKYRANTNIPSIAIVSASTQTTHKGIETITKQIQQTTIYSKEEIRNANNRYNELFDNLTLYMEGKKQINGIYQKQNKSISEVIFGGKIYRERIKRFKDALTEIIFINKKYRVGDQKEIRTMRFILQYMNNNPELKYVDLAKMRKAVRGL